jgi:hypothetical protein
MMATRFISFGRESVTVMLRSVMLLRNVKER